MNDIENLRAELNTLTVKVQVQQDYINALKHIVFHGLQNLHTRGILRMQDVADTAESSDAFARASFGHPKVELLSPLIKALRDIGGAYDDLKQAGKP